MAQNDVSRELRAFYEAYIDGFNRADLAAMSEKFDSPWVMVSDAGVMSFADGAATAAMMGQVLDGLRGRGWVRSTIDSLEAWPAGQQGGVLIVAYSRLRADGEPIERGKACYILRRSDDGWKIASLVDSFGARAG